MAAALAVLLVALVAVLVLVLVLRGRVPPPGPPPAAPGLAVDLEPPLASGMRPPPLDASPALRAACGASFRGPWLG